MKKILSILLISFLFTSCRAINVDKVAELNGVYEYTVNCNDASVGYAFAQNAFGKDAIITRPSTCSFNVITKVNMFKGDDGGK